MFDYWQIKCEKRERVGSEYSVNAISLWIMIGHWKCGSGCYRVL